MPVLYLEILADAGARAIDGWAMALRSDAAFLHTATIKGRPLHTDGIDWSEANRVAICNDQARIT